MFKRKFRFRMRGRGWRWHRRGKKGRRIHTKLSGYRSLADVPPGCIAKVLGFTQYLPPERISHFQAFGLVPGHKVRVLQHSPVTVVQIEHTELALERDLAREIQVTEIEK